jgi:di/tricarboxylate transporter
VSVDIAAIVFLIAIFAIGTFSSLNLGAVGLVASFAFGAFVLNEGPSKVLAGFPADLFMLLFGITYLFSVATANGTMDWVVASLARFVVRDRPAVVPWLAFGVAALASTLGAPGPAAAGLVSALAMGLAVTFGIRPILVALMVINGAIAGYFTPVHAIAIVAFRSAESVGLEADWVPVFLSVFAMTAGLAAAAFVIFGGRSLRARARPAAARLAGVATSSASERAGIAGGRTAASIVGSPAASATRPATAHVITLAAIVVVAIGALVLELDLGVLGATAALVLHLAFPRKDAAAHISWNVILLVCGIVTYIATLERAGTIARVGEGMSQLGSPFLTALLLCTAAAVISAFASSTATIAAVVPLGAALFQSGEVSPVGLFIAILISASLVDASPLTSTGALVLANAPEADQSRVYRQLLFCGLSLIVVAPTVACLLFVLPSTF